jgi:hypothetical protein
LRVAAGPAAPKLDQQTAQETMVVPEVAPATGSVVNDYDPQTAGAVDRMIRMGRPNGEIIAFAKSKGYPPPSNLDAAKLYMKANPGYKGGFTVATKGRRLSDSGVIPGTALPERSRSRKRRIFTHWRRNRCGRVRRNAWFRR